MKIVLLLLTAFLLMLPLQAQVLGPCSSGAPGGEQQVAPPPPPSSTGTTALLNSPVPLPGEQALDFKLAAVVGDEIKEIKLSDYNGKWRIVCFFPAAFTFV